MYDVYRGLKFPGERPETLQSGKISCIFLDDVSTGDQSHSSDPITVDRSNCARASTRFRCKSQQTNSIRRQREVREPRRRNAAQDVPLRTSRFPALFASPLTRRGILFDGGCSFREYVSLCRGVMFRKY